VIRVGEIEGTKVGDKVGAGLGLRDGPVGFIVGVYVGKGVGVSVGEYDGLKLGVSVGLAEGANDGEPVSSPLLLLLSFVLLAESPSSHSLPVKSTVMLATIPDRTTSPMAYRANLACVERSIEFPDDADCATERGGVPANDSWFRDILLMINLVFP
jgi:hypothetical protein